MSGVIGRFCDESDDNSKYDFSQSSNFQFRVYCYSSVLCSHSCQLFSQRGTMGRLNLLQIICFVIEGIGSGTPLCSRDESEIERGRCRNCRLFRRKRQSVSGEILFSWQHSELCPKCYSNCWNQRLRLDMILLVLFFLLVPNFFLNKCFFES